jgi:hypothetical protein
MRSIAAAVLALAVGAARVAAADPVGAFDEAVDRVDRALEVSTPGGLVRAELSGLADLEGYWIDERAPGLVFADDDSFVNPRLSLFLDVLAGRYVYGFVQARVDRGFDPRSASGADARADEYLVRVSPLADARLQLQAGKFATVVGGWVPRHLSWDNPFVTAPLPYERVTTVSDVRAPADPGEFLARRQIADNKREWVPMLWGPSYTSGAAAFGRLGDFDYAGEVKNAALSSRPAVWDGSDRGWDAPTVSGRLGWRPSPAWTVGVSGSRGAYLRSRAAPTLATGRHARDYHQSLVGADASYAIRHLQLWAEFFASRFEVPRLGQADVAAWYLEARYKLTPAVFAAARWNQQVFGDVPDGRGGKEPWDDDMWRLDTALTWRMARHLQGKVQYSIGRERGRLQQGEQLVAMQMTLKF